MDPKTLKPGTLVKWGTKATPSRLGTRLLNLYSCADHDPVTIAPLKQGYQFNIQTRPDDMFVLLTAHPTRGATWKLYSCRLGINVWLLNRAFWQTCEIVSEPE